MSTTNKTKFKNGKTKNSKVKFAWFPTKTNLKKYKDLNNKTLLAYKWIWLSSYREKSVFYPNTKEWVVTNHEFYT